MQKKKTYRNKKYLNWLRSRPCVVTGPETEEGSVIAHHVRMGNNGGIGLKPSDYRCISLDAIEHRKLHDGGERRYYAYHKLNTDQLISMNLLLYIAETTEPDDTETLRDLIEALEGVIDVRDNPDG